MNFTDAPINSQKDRKKNLSLNFATHWTMSAMHEQKGLCSIMRDCFDLILQLINLSAPTWLPNPKIKQNVKNQGYVIQEKKSVE